MNTTSPSNSTNFQELITPPDDQVAAFDRKAFDEYLPASKVDFTLFRGMHLYPQDLDRLNSGELQCLFSDGRDCANLGQDINNGVSYCSPDYNNALQYTRPSPFDDPAASKQVMLVFLPHTIATTKCTKREDLSNICQRIHPQDSSKDACEKLDRPCHVRRTEDSYASTKVNNNDMRTIASKDLKEKFQHNGVSFFLFEKT